MCLQSAWRDARQCPFSSRVLFSVRPLCPALDWTVSWAAPRPARRTPLSSLSLLLSLGIEEGGEGRRNVLVSSVKNIVIVIVTPLAPSELRDVLLELTMTSQPGCILVPRDSFQVAFLSAKGEVPVPPPAPPYRGIYSWTQRWVSLTRPSPVSRPLPLFAAVVGELVRASFFPSHAWEDVSLALPGGPRGGNGFRRAARLLHARHLRRALSSLD